MLNFLKNIGPVEMVVIIAILLLFFGRKLFVALGKTSGETFKELKNIKKNLTDNESNNTKKEV